MSPLPTWFRKALTYQVIALPVLLLGYAVVMVGATLLESMKDVNGSLALRWVGTVLVMLFALAAVGIVFILGWERVVLKDENHH